MFYIYYKTFGFSFGRAMNNAIILNPTGHPLS
jgi:hypothetical protein